MVLQEFIGAKDGQLEMPEVIIYKMLLEAFLLHFVACVLQQMTNNFPSQISMTLFLTQRETVPPAGGGGGSYKNMLHQQKIE